MIGVGSIVLTADLVRARIRDGKVVVRGVDAKARERILGTVERFVAILADGVGRSAKAIEDAFAAIPADARDARLLVGLRKLLFDRCAFNASEGVAPEEIRRAVFGAATEARRSSTSDEPFEREAVLLAVAEAFSLSVDEVEGRLYADLKSAHRLVSFEHISAEALIDHYELAQEQAVLLRATEVRLRIQFREAGAARAFFRKLKFRRLLCRIYPEDDGWYAIQIDGPFSLFQASTKYGLQLALLLPAIRAAGRFELDADVRWGTERQPALFRLSSDASAAPEKPLPLADDVQRLITRFRKLDTGWTIRPSRRLLSIPGYGLCVPDLVFSRGGKGPKVYLEILGFWSREAVWRRIELVNAGLRDHVIFAVSSRLRVSEQALDDDLPSELYVYKGAMSAKTIAERLEAYGE